MHVTEQHLDPFGDDIVTEPRQIQPPVESLNRKGLEKLLEEFRRLQQTPLPRLSRDRGALLVLSPDPGYGKSHLIGRIFRLLDDDATLLYLRPFQDPSSCWISLLEKAVFELDHPDSPDKLVCDPGEHSQLDTLARQILMRLFAELKAGRLQHPQKDGALRLFDRYPNTALEAPEWRNWLEQQRDPILDTLEPALHERGIELQPNRRAWLKVLLAYAYGEHDREVRQLCLDWLACRPLDTDEGKRLGLRPADLPEVDAPYEQRNERCFQRLKDLFTIGSFYRPFLLCLDQTELYGGDKALARSLGVVLSRLRREACNHLVIVTANAPVWDDRVACHFEKADAHAVNPSTVELRGITREQAVELIGKRLGAWGNPMTVEAFLGDGGWLNDLYTEREERGVREILRACQARWSTGQATRSMQEIFESYRRRLLSQPRGLEYDANVVQWAVEHILGPAAEARVERIRSPKGYLTVKWRGETRHELFGFESGSHWRRWEAILREAELYMRDAPKPDTVRSTFFRLPHQPKLPDRVLNQIAAGITARLIHLTQEDAASLFAAHDFIADVMQQNHLLDLDRVFEFLRQSLRKQSQYVWGGKSPPSNPVPDPPPDALARRIADHVQRKRFLTIQLLMMELPAEPAITEATVLEACRSLKHVKVHTSPGNTVLQWRP